MSNVVGTPGVASWPAARMPGVKSVHVNLAHEETLIEFDPKRVAPQKFEQTLNDLGYTVRSLDRLRASEEEQAELARKRDDLLFAAALALVSLAAMTLMWLELLPPSGMASLYWLMPLLALATMPDLNPTLNDRITLTLRVMLPRILARRFLNARSMSSFVRRD
jgi:cation transport ATPase